jgi:hypothetical protein
MNDPVFSFLKKGGGGGSQVFNVFLKGVPNSNSLYPIFFAQSFPLLSYIVEPEGRHSILT